MNQLLLIAAGASLCLAIAMWIALVAARGLLHRAAVRRREGRPRAGLAIAEYCADGDREALARKLAQVPVDDIISVAGRALPALPAVDRRAVGAALAQCGIVADIRTRFGRADEQRRTLYCELLGVIGGADAVVLLEEALRRGPAGVRIAAGIALLELGRELPSAMLLNLVGAQARRSSRLVALLQKLVPHHEEEICALVVNPREEPRLRVSALQALELARPERHRALILQLGQEPDPLLATATVRALAQGGSSQAAAVLMPMLRHPSPTVRREAAAATGSAGLVQALPALRDLTGDANAAVAAAAARSMWLLRQRAAPSVAVQQGAAA